MFLVTPASVVLMGLALGIIFTSVFVWVGTWLAATRFSQKENR